MSLSRRRFIRNTATSLVALGGSGSILRASSPAMTPGPGNKWPGRVAINFNGRAASGTTPNEQVIRKMVDDTIMLLTGERTVGAAWKAVFPATLTLQSKIAIKINILNNSLPRPSEFSVAAICEGLLQMDFNGTRFPASGITIYDANNANTMDSAGYTAARFPNIARIKDTFQNYGDGARNLAYATTLNSHQFLINVFSPRGIQGGNAEGFSLGFKSHYGTYANPSSYHNTASPAHLRDINCTGPVLTKTVLSVCSGIFGMNEGTGPRGEAADYSTYARKIDPDTTATSPCTIMMSTDPVSIEMQTIKMMRMNRNPTADYSTAALPSYLKASGGVSGSLVPVYNIGVIDETKMEIRRRINDETMVSGHPSANLTEKTPIRIWQTRNQNVVLIEVARVRRSSHPLILRIHDLRGTLVFETDIMGTGDVAMYTWNRRDRAGNVARSGHYIATVIAGGGVTRSQRFTIA